MDEHDDIIVLPVSALNMRFAVSLQDLSMISWMTGWIGPSVIMVLETCYVMCLPLPPLAVL
jgi:hypothetical protein